MNFNVLGSNIKTLHTQVLFLAGICLAEAVSLVIAVGAATGIKERVVVVPPGLSGPVAIDWGKADAEYIKAFSLFYATLVGSITPRNITYVADRLSAMTSSVAYPQIRRQLLMLSKDPVFMDQATSSNFVSYQLIYEPERNKVFVVGEVRVQGGGAQPKVFPTVYEMTITINEGRPIVHAVNNYAGSEAHTASWIEEHPDWDKSTVDQK